MTGRFVAGKSLEAHALKPMRASGGTRVVAAALVATITACSLWAALDNPYKSDPGDTTGDGSAEGGGRDAALGRRVLDAGFVPYAIAVHGDTVYAVDPLAGVHVADDASTYFTPFWTGDGGDTFALQSNAIAATASGVFWTVSAGIHYCNVDGGACGFLPLSNAPRAVAASDPAVAWIDNGGVRACTMGLVGCLPVSIAGSRGAVSVAVGPTGIIAWTDGGTNVQLDDGVASTSVSVHFDVALVATDDVSGSLYWVGQGGVGFMQFDGGGGAAFSLTSMTKPIEFFVRRGVAFWSLRANNGIVLYCRSDSDAGCLPKQLVNGLMPAPTTNDGIVATSREVLAIVSSNLESELFAWPRPP